MAMKKISVLGSTGTIGLNTLEIVRKNRDRLLVTCLVADNNWEMLLEQIIEFKPHIAVINNEKYYKTLSMAVKKKNLKTNILAGIEGIITASTFYNADIILSAISGISGILPTYEAIKAGKTVALANKESLVSAGSLIMPYVKKRGSKILPVDSEHSAIFQLLIDKDKKDIQKIILPASGGPFLNKTKEQLENITVKEALHHPVWKMGKKISIDSATLANKGLEVIEAHYLFDLSYNKISVLIHPQCIVHGMVEMKDGTLFAHLGYPDMKMPISYALFYPERISKNRRCGMREISKLTFEEVDFKKFPFLKLAYEVGKMGKSYAAVFNVADEIAVLEFIKGNITYGQIYSLVEDAVLKHNGIEILDINDVMEVEKWTKDFISRKIKTKGKKGIL